MSSQHSRARLCRAAVSVPMRRAVHANYLDAAWRRAMRKLTVILAIASF
jgi:hypothetical protein